MSKHLQQVAPEIGEKYTFSIQIVWISTANGVTAIVNHTVGIPDNQTALRDLNWGAPRRQSKQWKSYQACTKVKKKSSFMGESICCHTCDSAITQLISNLLNSFAIKNLHSNTFGVIPCRPHLSQELTVALLKTCISRTFPHLTMQHLPTHDTQVATFMHHEPITCEPCMANLPTWAYAVIAQFRLFWGITKLLILAKLLKAEWKPAIKLKETDCFDHYLFLS